MRDGQVRLLNVSKLGYCLFRGSGAFGLRSLLDQLTHGVCRLGAFLDPIANAISLELDRGRLASRIISSDVFQKRAIAFRLLLFDHNAIRGSLFRAGTHQSDC